MKKIINALKRQSKLLIGIFIGVIIMGGISYGVNQIQSSSVSYTKSDGTIVSVKQALDELISKATTLNSENEQLKEKYKGIEYLADVAKVGDYVAYDAGSWTETKAQPTSHGQFGGYTVNQNKANSVACYGSTALKGWCVFSIDTSTKTVTLIHAGQAECYYHASGNRAGASVTNLNNRANTYLNSDYADSARLMTKAEAETIDKSNNLRRMGAPYWLSFTDDNNRLWKVNGDGSINGGYDHSGGVRPVIVLKSNILTAGKGTDYVGQTAWTLVKP